MSIPGAVIGVSAAIPTVIPLISQQAQSGLAVTGVPVGAVGGIASTGGFDAYGTIPPAAKGVSTDQIIHIFVLGAFILIMIYAWISVVNILIDIYYEVIHPSTVTLDAGITNSDFLYVIYKQVTFAVIVTVILFIYLWYF
jgi:hypothetical protein